MRVTRLKILTSVFYKYDTGEEAIIPNSILTTTNIINLNITPDQSDKLEFVVDRQTPLEDIKDLEIGIQKLLDEDLEYSSSTKVVKSEICKGYVRMSIYFKYLVSYLSAETKAVHKSKILTTIMKFLKKMEINRKEYFPSYEPFTVEITLDRKIKLSDVEELEAEILSGLDNRYKPHSKVVVTELTNSTMKMGVYMGSKYMWKARGNEDENSPQTNGLICVMEKRFKDGQMRNLVEISEAVRRGIQGVNLEIHRPVKDGDDEVIAHGGLVWSNDVGTFPHKPPWMACCYMLGLLWKIREDHNWWTQLDQPNGRAEASLQRWRFQQLWYFSSKGQSLRPNITCDIRIEARSDYEYFGTGIIQFRVRTRKLEPFSYELSSLRARKRMAESIVFRGLNCSGP